MKKQKPLFSVLLSGILWGCISLFVKKLSTAGFDSMQICLIRMVISAVCFVAVVAVVSPKKLKIAPKDIWIFVCTGIVSVVLFNCCYFYTVIHSQASVAVVLLYTSPVFIMILSAIFFKEKITVQKVIALVLTLGGCVLVAGVVGGSYSLSPAVLLTGIGSGLFYGLYTIFGRVALKKYDTLTVTAYTFLFGMVGSLPIGKISSAAAIVAEQPIVLLWCFGIAIFCTVLPYFFYTWGLQRMESGKAAIVVAVEPLVGAVIGMTVFKESHDASKIIGIAMILLAIVLLNLHFPRKRKEAIPPTHPKEEKASENGTKEEI